MRHAARSSNKYHAVKTTADGYTFDSKAEAARYGELKLLERAGEITGLVVHPLFGLAAGNDARTTIGCYEGDFAYKTRPIERLVVEDVKGIDTPLSVWKRRHVKAQYGIDVQIVKGRR